METFNCLSETFSNKQKAYEKYEKEFFSCDSFLLIDVENQDISYYECFTPLKLSPIEKSKSLTDLIGNKNIKPSNIASSNEPIIKNKESVSSSNSELKKKNTKLKVIKNPSDELKFKRKLDFYKDEINQK